MASKLRKTPRGHANTMTATACLQGLGIDFAFMVQKSSDSKRFDNLVGHNGETCYVLITDHFSGRLIGRAFATKAPPVDWLNQWLANNAPTCAGKYVRMDGGGELGRCRKSLIHSPILVIRPNSLALTRLTKMARRTPSPNYR
ncbi:hypothetical protein MHU86_13644 [Fragilaria crotonensis]|nr:hypothetical protein MHU86_13644 [Fragilaria crotonensis]